MFLRMQLILRNVLSEYTGLTKSHLVKYKILTHDPGVNSIIMIVISLTILVVTCQWRLYPLGKGDLKPELSLSHPCEELGCPKDGWMDGMDII